MDARRTTRIGLALACALLAAWSASVAGALFFYEFTPAGIWLAPWVVLWITWLDVGLFIVAHDCMHGTAFPLYPRANRGLGRLCLLLYAGFDFDQLTPKHHAHHHAPGTESDPDYAPVGRTQFGAWYLSFLRTYSSTRQLAIVTALCWLLLMLGAPLLNVLLFWALPAISSSLQLFLFGTYLPHRPRADAPFCDEHRARSDDLPRWLSLLTCFHFGYHREHHLHPELPWWQLPSARAHEQRREQSSAQHGDALHLAASHQPDRRAREEACLGSHAQW